MDLTYFVLTPSEEAKICLDCTNKKCIPSNCERYAKEIKKLKREKGAAEGTK